MRDFRRSLELGWLVHICNQYDTISNPLKASLAISGLFLECCFDTGLHRSSIGQSSIGVQAYVDRHAHGFRLAPQLT